MVKSSKLKFILSTSQRKLRLPPCGHMPIPANHVVVYIHVCQHSGKIHISDVLGCILSDVPGVIRDLGSLNIRLHHPAVPASVNQVPACIPAATSHGSFQFIQSHLVAFSVASVMERMSPFFAALVILSTDRALQS